MRKKIFLVLTTLTLTLIILFQTQLWVGAQNSEDNEITQGTLMATTEEGKKIECPLKHTEVNAEISGFISKVEVTQEFENPFNNPIEAIYIFPLPHNGAVNSMEMKVGDRTIVGLIKTREEAREIYETAKEQGQLTGLLEQERANIFTQSVANIKPGDSILVKITYVEILNYDDGTYEFVFPMVVGPRYNPSSVEDPEKITPEYLKPEQRSGHDISVKIELDAGIPIQDIKSTSHEVTINTEGETKATVNIKPYDSIPNKDFILQYNVMGEKPECAAITTGKKGNGYFTLMIQPKATYSEDEITPKEMVFVLDCSGSMSGHPMDTSKAVMQKCIEFMNPNDTFQIIRFSENASGLSDKPLPNTPENIRKGLDYVNNLKGTGGTQMIEGIRAALNFPHDPERMRIVFFLTDGYIGNETEIFSEIEENLGETRLFSLGVGSSTNRFLLDMMAETGRGEVQYVRPGSDITEAVEQFYERISNPYFTDISIDWKGLKVEDIYPKRIPDLFSSQPLFIYGRYSEPGSAVIEVSGNIAGEKTTLPVEIEFLENDENNSALSSIWARQKIKDLDNKQFRGDIPEIVSQITALALEFKLMSKYTSFVAVEESYEVNDQGELQTVMVPVEMPESVSYEGVFGVEECEDTASSGLMYNNCPSCCPAPEPTEPPLRPESEKNVITIDTENLNISLATKTFKIPTDFDFSSTDKKSITVQILKNGELLKKVTGDSDELKVDKKNLTVELKESPFTESSTYIIIIEIEGTKIKGTATVEVK